MTTPLRPPTRLDLEEIVTSVATRAVRWLEKHGYLRDAECSDERAEGSEADSPWLRCLRGSLGVGELHRSTEHADESADSADRSRGRSPPRPSKGLGAQYLRFNLHAGVSVPGGLPAARERLLRYCARPPLALERLALLDDGRISYRIKDTDQFRLMTPTQFLARLAALVPPPRHPLVRFYGVWAPHSQWRSRVVPGAPELKRSAGAESEPNRPCCTSLAVENDTAAARAHEQMPPSPPRSSPTLSRSSSQPDGASLLAPTRPEAVLLGSDQAVAHGRDEPRFARLSRIDWATLYQRVFDVDPLECSSCGGRMRFVEVIEDVARARSELGRRGLPAAPPPLSRARSPDCVD